MLQGHEEPARQWQAAVGSDKLHHAWLLSGPRGIGKMHFAIEAGRKLVGGDAPATEHPDIHILSQLPKDEKEDKKRAEGKPFERKRNIGVGQVRSMQKRLTTRPTLGDKRVIIIDAADDMERSASNALLKSLEEPPSGSHFLLVSHQPSKLLPTIRSRCRALRFAALSEEQLRHVLAKQDVDATPEALHAAIEGANGSPGLALQLIALKLGEVRKAMAHILEGGDPHFEARAALANAIGPRPDRERLAAVVSLARSLLAKNMAKGSREDFSARHTAYLECERLAAEIATFNYDPGLLAMEIGSLLANAARPTKRHYA